MELKEDEQYPIIRTLTEALPAPIVDDLGAVQYIGYASLGTGQDKPGWKITRVTTAGSVTITEYADGDMKYDNKWSDRATLDYSR